MGCKLIFSCLFAEAESYLRFYIRNFLSFTNDDCGLVVNCGLKVDAEALNQISNRVIVQHAGVPRRKIGPTLLIGHIENFEAAITRFGDFELFCTTASNALFVDMVDLRRVRQEMEQKKPIPKYRTDRLPDRWHWPSVSTDPLFLRYMAQIGVTEVSYSQIEGLCLGRDDWARVAAHRPILEASARQGLETFPYEEVLPMTTLAQSSRPQFSILCHTFWDRQQTAGGTTHVDDLLAPPSSFSGQGTTKSDPVLAMKWFRRTEKDAMTAFLCGEDAPSHLTMLRKLAASPPEDPVRRFYDNAFRAVLSSRITRDLFSDILAPLDADSGRTLYDRVGVCADRQLDVITGADRLSASAYVLYEDARVACDVRLQILQSGEALECHVSCKPFKQLEPVVEAQESSGTLVGYVYFPSHILHGGRILFAAEAVLREGVHSPEIGRFTCCYKSAYAVAGRLQQQPPRHIDGVPKHGEMYSAVTDPVNNKDVCYVGIPIVFDTKVEYKVCVFLGEMDPSGPDERISE